MKISFKASLRWTNNSNDEKNHNNRSKKNHHILFDENKSLYISAAKAFKGDPNLLNPEDLLLSSLMSCHMMSYLYVCEKNGLQIESYTDNAEAVLETAADGSGRITEVHLYPKVKILNQLCEELAISLHCEANKLCFIANSCNFPVYHHPEIVLK